MKETPPFGSAGCTCKKGRTKDPDELPPTIISSKCPHHGHMWSFPSGFRAGVECLKVPVDTMVEVVSVLAGRMRCDQYTAGVVDNLLEEIEYKICDLRKMIGD